MQLREWRSINSNSAGAKLVEDLSRKRESLLRHREKRERERERERERITLPSSYASLQRRFCESLLPFFRSYQSHENTYA